MYIYIYIFIRTRSTHFNINFNTIKQSYRQVNREGHSVHTSFIIAVISVISIQISHEHKLSLS